ncbi:MAG TPA: (2Fe-2S)-binding protein [Clostridiaceae bacterium]|nr:(2Fe-2S)-binding protein [Clostridiaceae bacterium]
MRGKISFTLNGQDIFMEADLSTRLIDFLRDELKLVGTKEGCSQGECGACTVIIDGRTANSCLILLGQVQGAAVTTIEGLGDEQNLHPIQQAFIEEGAVQCGYCIPGMVLSAKALLDKNNKPGKEDIRRAISGNLCRCTGYKKIEKAIIRASEKMKEAGYDDGNP